MATSRLHVRPWRAEDVARAYDLYSRWEVARWLGASPRALGHRDEAVAMLERWAGRNADEARGGIWAVEVAETGVVAGTVLLLPLPDGDGDYEIGWHFHPDSWGRGYATEAAAAVLDRARTAGLSHVLAVTRPDNTPSMAVCRRLGMEHLGLTDRYYGTGLQLFRARLSPEPS